MYLSASLKTKLFCETSSVFELDNIKNSAILWGFLKFWTWQRISANLKTWCSKMHPLFRKSAPWPPNISHEHVFCTALATRNASLQILFKCPTPAIVFGNATKPSRFAYFWQGAQSLLPTTQNDIWTSKSAPSPSVFCIFDFEMCFAPQLRALFRHLNFQKWPEPGVFCTFGFEMCFAPQRRALFRHFNFQKWPEPGVCCTFWLRNVLRATTACTFSTSQLPKVVRAWCVLYFDLETCFAPQRRALFRYLNFQKWSEHGVFCTFWLRNALRATTACNFSSLIWPAGSAPAALASLLFDRSLKSLEKHSVSRLSYFFAHLRLLSSDSFSSLIFSLLLSSSLCLCPTLLFIWPYCRKFDF